MKIKKVNVFNDNPEAGVDNLYPTPKHSFKQPALHLVIGQRTMGKSFLASKIIAEYQKHKTFDRIYIITPSFNSNKAYFGKYIKEEDVYEPTKDSINLVIAEVEKDRDEFETYLEKVERFKELKKELKSKKVVEINEDNLMYFDELGLLDEKPTWKYDKVEPPKSLLILDDVLGSPAILQSSGLTRIATLNRHIAPLKENFKNRSACGLGVMILSQSYRMNNGISRVLRENLSLLTLFKNKQEAQMKVIKEELGNVVDEELFEKAYEYATEAKYGNLTIDFNAKCKTETFRKNLNEIIKFDSLKCECNK